MDAYGKRNIFLFILPELDLSWNLIILYLQGELKKHTMANIDMYIEQNPKLLVLLDKSVHLFMVFFQSFVDRKQVIHSNLILFKRLTYC